MFSLFLLTTARGLIGPSAGFKDDGYVDQTHGYDDGWGTDDGCADLSCKECTSYNNECVFYRNECIWWFDVDEYANPDDRVDSYLDCPDHNKGSSSGSGWEPDRAFDQSKQSSFSYMKPFTGTCKGLGCLPCTEYHTSCVFYKNKCMSWKDPPMDAEHEDYTPHVKCPNYVLRYAEKSVAMVHPASSTGSQNFLVTGFALVGFGAMVYGAANHYLLGKKDGSHTSVV